MHSGGLGRFLLHAAAVPHSRLSRLFVRHTTGGFCSCISHVCLVESGGNDLSVAQWVLDFGRVILRKGKAIGLGVGSLLRDMYLDDGNKLHCQDLTSMVMSY